MHWRTVFWTVVLGLPIVGVQVSPWAGTWWATAAVSGIFVAALITYHWKTLTRVRFSLAGNPEDSSLEILYQLDFINERITERDESSQQILDQIALINQRIDELTAETGEWLRYLRRETARTQINQEAQWMLKYVNDLARDNPPAFRAPSDDCTRRLRELVASMIAGLENSPAPEQRVQQFAESSRTIMTAAGFGAYFAD